MIEQGINIKNCIYAVLITFAVILVGLSVISPIKICEHSMMPTLMDGDYVLINKAAYLNKEHPETGDIIVFKAEGEERMLVKRVIGVEGDTIKIKKGKVYRNGEPIEEPYTFDTQTEGKYKCEIPRDEIFVMGDNRAASYDSREIGTIPEKDIVGKVWTQVYPFAEFGEI